MTTRTYTGELEATPCCVCGITFGVPSRYLQEIRETGGSLHCPNGHSLTWREHAGNVRKQLERQLAAERARLDQAKAEIASQRGRLNATRGVVTRLRNRVANGVCPCCNRSFENLRRHMTTKHPDWKKKSTEPSA